MGNRANIVLHAGPKDIGPTIYVHWNGGPESIYAFLEEGKRRKSICHDVGYSTARLVQIIADFFDQDKRDGLSICVYEPPKSINATGVNGVNTDNSDNGFFVFDVRDWTCRRFRLRGFDQKLKELSVAEVNAEREAALKHEYASALPVTFRNIDDRLYGEKAVKAQ